MSSTKARRGAQTPSRGRSKKNSDDAWKPSAAEPLSDSEQEGNEVVEETKEKRGRSRKPKDGGAWRPDKKEKEDEEDLEEEERVARQLEIEEKRSRSRSRSRKSEDGAWTPKKGEAAEDDDGSGDSEGEKNKRRRKSVGKSKSTAKAKAKSKAKAKAKSKSRSGKEEEEEEQHEQEQKEEEESQKEDEEEETGSSNNNQKQEADSDEEESETEKEGEQDDDNDGDDVDAEQSSDEEDDDDDEDFDIDELVSAVLASRDSSFSSSSSSSSSSASLRPLLPGLDESKSALANLSDVDELRQMKQKHSHFVKKGAVFQFRDEREAGTVHVAASAIGTHEHRKTPRELRADVDLLAKLAKSEVAPPLDPKEAAKAKKAKKPDTAGSRWFNLPATPITPEVKQNLKVIAMRSYLDPRRFYKKDSRKTLPKYFQIGTVVEGAADFYSARLTKAERKSNLLEEVLANNKERNYLKRKFAEIQEAKRPAPTFRKRTFKGKGKGGKSGKAGGKGKR